MGTGDHADETPAHTVTLDGFRIDPTEVTQADYLAVMGVNPSRFKGDDQRPVENVTWFDAVLFCNARSKAEGRDTVYLYSAKDFITNVNCGNLEDLSVNWAADGYRLPTEAEWEFACRGGSAAAYWWGDTLNPSLCWLSDNSNDTTHPVAKRQPNAFGLYDMAGNVWEWVGDWYAAYDTVSRIDPLGPALGTEKIFRGGSFLTYGWALRSPNRDAELPEYRSKDLGFRTVLTVAEKNSE